MATNIKSKERRPSLERSPKVTLHTSDRESKQAPRTVVLDLARGNMQLELSLPVRTIVPLPRRILP